MADLTAQFTDKLVELGKKFAEPIDIGDGFLRYRTPNGDLAIIRPASHSDFADTPPRIRQTVTVHDVESFLTYWSLYSDDDSRVFADRNSGRLAAVMDYHQSEDDRLHGARWCDHRCILQLRNTAEWTAWKTNSGNRMTQSEFAEFMEDNAPDIINPSSAVMLELATTLNVTTSAHFEQATNLHNGQVQLSYREEVKGSLGGAEKKTVPREFTILVSVYEGQPAIEVTARIRYRANGGKLAIWYDLLHADRKMREAFELVSDQVAKAGVTVFNGNV